MQCSIACHGRVGITAPTSTRSVVAFSGRGRGGYDWGSGDGLLLGGQPGRRGGDGDRPPPKLVLPGRGGPPGVGGRLVIPDKGMQDMVGSGETDLGPEVVTATGPTRYRPPPGFMNEQPDDHSEIASMEPDVMLNKLRSRAGKWHYLAKMFTPLYQSGIDSASVDQMTGITPVMQNKWMVAATVYDSLVASGRLSQEQLSWFDGRGDDLLYPFRFLTQDMRAEAAEYILENNLDAQACEVLARAMKEWERRPTERHGFSNSPGDCMAFKYLRDAGECRKIEEAEVKLAEAVEAAVTDSARDRIVEAWEALKGGGDEEDEEEAPSSSGLAALTVLRLDADEIGFRPIPLLGELGQVTEGDLDVAPRTSQRGAFGAFTIDGQASEMQWVALPQWKALAMSRYPVALMIEDCADERTILEGMKAKTEDDVVRASGPALLVVDRKEVVGEEADASRYYLVPEGDWGAQARLTLVEGGLVAARGLTALAEVVFLARPPVRAEPLVAGDQSLIQL